MDFFIMVRKMWVKGYFVISVLNLYRVNEICLVMDELWRGFVGLIGFIYFLE